MKKEFLATLLVGFFVEKQVARDKLVQPCLVGKSHRGGSYLPGQVSPLSLFSILSFDFRDVLIVFPPTASTTAPVLSSATSIFVSSSVVFPSPASSSVIRVLFRLGQAVSSNTFFGRVTSRLGVDPLEISSWLSVSVLRSRFMLKVILPCRPSFRGHKNAKVSP